VINDYFGTKIADRIATWSIWTTRSGELDEAQNEYTRRVLARISGRDELRARIEQLDKSVPAALAESCAWRVPAIFTISC